MSLLKSLDMERMKLMGWWGPTYYDDDGWDFHREVLDWGNIRNSSNEWGYLTIWKADDSN